MTLFQKSSPGGWRLEAVASVCLPKLRHCLRTLAGGSASCRGPYINKAVEASVRTLLDVVVTQYAVGAFTAVSFLSTASIACPVQPQPPAPPSIHHHQRCRQY